MDRISYNSLKLLSYFENLNPQKSGIFFSIIIHLFILLFMVGLPNFFSPKEIYVPNVIPIEILNVTENTNLKKTETKKQDNKNKETIIEQKKFNSSDQLEVKKNIEITSMADLPAGTGLGSSSTYTIGLLNALHCLKRDHIKIKDLAEEACEIEIDILKKPMGKQDQYLAAYGGFVILEISRDGHVEVSNAKLSVSTIDQLKSNLLIFYTGEQRSNKKILK